MTTVLIGNQVVQITEDKYKRVPRSKRTLWNKEDDEKLLYLYLVKNKSLSSICSIMKRSKHSCTNRLNKLRNDKIR